MAMRSGRPLVPAAERETAVECSDNLLDPSRWQFAISLARLINERRDHGDE